MLAVGTRAPEFVLQDNNSDDVSLSDLLQHGPLILYFYPADFTPGCTKEACTIRDIHDDIRSVGLQVAGISPQDAESHERFRKEHQLPFVLLCDPDKVAVKMYEVDGPLGFGVRRVTYLINQDRSIQDAMQADLRISKHAEFIEKAIVLREAAGMKSTSGDE